MIKKSIKLEDKQKSTLKIAQIYRNKEDNYTKTNTNSVIITNITDNKYS